MPRYLITVTEEDAQRLEKWLGPAFGVFIMPITPDGEDLLADLREPDGHVPDYHRAEADQRLEKVRPAAIAGLDAVTDDELAAVDERLKESGPLYHAGGPEEES